MAVNIGQFPQRGRTTWIDGDFILPMNAKNTLERRVYQRGTLLGKQEQYQNLCNHL